MIVCLFVWSSTSFCSYSRVPILAAIYICTGADSNNVRSQRVHTIEEHFVVSQQVLELLGSNNPPPLRAFAWSVLFVLESPAARLLRLTQSPLFPPHVSTCLVGVTARCICYSFC